MPNGSGSFRFRAMIRTIVWLFMCVVFAGASCRTLWIQDKNSKTELEFREGSNLSRYVFAWKTVSKSDGADVHRLHTCVEFPGPAAGSRTINAGQTVSELLKVPGADFQNKKDVIATYTENVAKLYAISEVGQVMHGVLFRLCEARGNGVIDDKIYKEQLEKIVSAMVRMMEMGKAEPAK